MLRPQSRVCDAGVRVSSPAQKTERDYRKKHFPFPRPSSVPDPGCFRYACVTEVRRDSLPLGHAVTELREQSPIDMPGILVPSCGCHVRILPVIEQMLAGHMHPGAVMRETLKVLDVAQLGVEAL